ncbi:hypothetical protein CTEST_06840 [Corynebacterium testudinoris]|uniref:Uncharacterized protein n=1 Tax=Corynebacterium testudinoris TaxID=136857 RepID=A0A0G3H7S2_9CORY|nr:hypothetical protein CTEST_06840 [Corynebacterium testudinoris]
MKLLNDFADKVKREKLLKDFTLVFNNLGEITAVFLSRAKGNGLVRGK